VSRPSSTYEPTSATGSTCSRPPRRSCSCVRPVALPGPTSRRRIRLLDFQDETAEDEENPLPFQGGYNESVEVLLFPGRPGLCAWAGHSGRCAQSRQCRSTSS
jgi:hypothetical protein